MLFLMSTVCRSTCNHIFAKHFNMKRNSKKHKINLLTQQTHCFTINSINLFLWKLTLWSLLLKEFIAQLCKKQWKITVALFSCRLFYAFSDLATSATFFLTIFWPCSSTIPELVEQAQDEVFHVESLASALSPSWTPLSFPSCDPVAFL